jgi:two-component system response regulator NreC
MSSLRYILIVDDHPTMIEGYKSILSSKYNLQQDLQIFTAYNCASAFREIKTKNQVFDLAIIDMILPPDEKEKIYSGEDLALLIQKVQPACKIIVSTSHTEGFVLYQLIKKINPQGVLVKSDYTSDEFILALNQVMQGGIYHSVTARQSIKEVQMQSQYLDSFNRKIISLLAKGVKTKSLPQHLNISISAIDKRKALIKEIFGILKGNDEDIIREAKKRGLV